MILLAAACAAVALGADPAGQWVAGNSSLEIAVDRATGRVEKLLDKAGKIGLGVAVDYALSWGLDAIGERVAALGEALRARLGRRLRSSTGTSR